VIAFNVAVFFFHSLSIFLRQFCWVTLSPLRLDIRTWVHPHAFGKLTKAIPPGFYVHSLKGGTGVPIFLPSVFNHSPVLVIDVEHSGIRLFPRLRFHRFFGAGRNCRAASMFLGPSTSQALIRLSVIAIISQGIIYRKFQLLWQNDVQKKSRIYSSEKLLAYLLEQDTIEKNPHSTQGTSLSHGRLNIILTCYAGWKHLNRYEMGKKGRLCTCQ